MGGLICIEWAVAHQKPRYVRDALFHKWAAAHSPQQARPLSGSRIRSAATRRLTCANSAARYGFVLCPAVSLRVAWSALEGTTDRADRGRYGLESAQSRSGATRPTPSPSPGQTRSNLAGAHLSSYQRP
jgi:hypothetical protein